MRLRKVCPQCSTVIHARRRFECGHAFTLKREARNTASSPAKRKRALESLEDTLRRQENNRIRMASMRSSETRHHGQYALCKCIRAPRVCTLVLFIDSVSLSLSLSLPLPLPPSLSLSLSPSPPPPPLSLSLSHSLYIMCVCERYIYTVLDIKRVENAFFHTMYIFSVILHAIDKQDIST